MPAVLEGFLGPKPYLENQFKKAGRAMAHGGFKCNKEWPLEGMWGGRYIINPADSAKVGW